MAPLQDLARLQTVVDSGVTNNLQVIA